MRRQTVRNIMMLASLMMPIGIIMFVNSDSVGWLAAAISGAVFLFIGIQISTHPGMSDGVKNGRLVSGRIVSSRDIGARANERMKITFTVEFATSDGQLIQTATERLVSPMEVPQLQPGTVVPIRYALADPRQCMIESADQRNLYRHISEVDRRVVEGNQRAGRITRESADAMLGGVKARGVVIRSTATGTTSDGRINYELWVRVTRPDGSTFDARKQATISKIGRWAMQVGRVADVFYHPEDEQTIFIDISPFRRRARRSEISSLRQ